MPPCQHAGQHLSFRQTHMGASTRFTWRAIDRLLRAVPGARQVTAPGFLGMRGGDPDRQSSYQVLHCWGLCTGHQTKHGWLLCAVNNLCLVCWPVERPQLSSTPSPPWWEPIPTLLGTHTPSPPCREPIPHPHPVGNPYPIPTLLGTHTPSPPCWEPIPHPHPVGNPYPIPTLFGTHTPSPSCWEPISHPHPVGNPYPIPTPVGNKQPAKTTVLSLSLWQ